MGSSLVTVNWHVLCLQPWGEAGWGGGPSSATPNIIPYYLDMYSARQAGVPRWSLFRDGNEASSAKMMVLGDAQVGYRSTSSGYMSTTGVSLNNPEWTMEGWWYFDRGAGYYLMTLKNATNRVGLEMNGGFRLTGSGLARPLNIASDLVAPDTETWVHIAMMLWQNNVYFYLNGQQVYTPTVMMQGWSALGNCQLSIGTDFGQGVFYGMFSNVCVSDRARYVDSRGNAVSRFPLALPETVQSSTKVLVQRWPPRNVVTNTAMTVVPNIDKVVMPTMQQNMPIAVSVPAYNFSFASAQGFISMLRLVDEWTVEAWVYWTGTATATWLDLSAEGPSQVGCRFFINSSNNCGIFFPLEGQSRTATGRQVTPQKWTHIAWTKAVGDGYAECFIDGVSAGYPTIPTSWWNTSSSVTLGTSVERPGVGRQQFSGNLSQVCIRNRRRYVDRIAVVPNLVHVTEGTDLLFFLGPNLTNINFGGAVATLTATGSVPEVVRLADDAN